MTRRAHDSWWSPIRRLRRDGEARRYVIVMLLPVVTVIGACGSQRFATRSTLEQEHAASRLLLAQAFPYDARTATMGERVTRFQRAVLRIAVSQCLRAARLPGPPGQFPLRGLNLDFPDMVLLRRTDSTGFLASYRTPYNPLARMSTSERAEYTSRLGSCTSISLRQDRLYEAEQNRHISFLVSKWGQTLAAVYGSMPAIRSGQHAKQCSARYGIAFRPVSQSYAQGFFGALFAKEQRLLSQRKASNARKLDHFAVHVFVRCFSSYELTLNSLRTAKYAQLVRADGAGIARYAQMAAGAVVQLEQRYGVTL
jgi:hypothetical protein